MSAAEGHEIFRRERAVDAGASADAAGAPSALRWPLLLVSIVLVGVFYWPTLDSILARWISDPTYSHGFLVAALGGWMTWRAWRRGELEGTRTSWLGLLPIIAAGVAWLLASAASVQMVQQLALPALVLGTAWALFGWRGLLVLAVPLGVVYFVLPAWDYLRQPLQNLTVAAVGQFLHGIGIPVFIHGHRVDLPNGSFEIVEGCSGLHFFMAAAALAAIQAYLFIGAHWARAVLMGAALVVAIVANWIRVAAVIIAGYLTDMQHFLVTVDHYYFGWVVFAILMLPVLYLGRRLELAAPPPPEPGARPSWSFQMAPGARMPVAVALLVLVSPSIAWTVIQANARIGPPPVLPPMAGDWRLSGDAAPGWQPVLPGATEILSGRYRYGVDGLEDGLNEVDAWLGYYERQETGRELIGYGVRMARPADGRLSVLGPGQLRLVTGKRDDRLIWFGYEVAGKVTNSALGAKLYQMQGNLGGRPTAYGVLFSARCRQADCEDARAALQSFEAAMRDRLPGIGPR